MGKLIPIALAEAALEAQAKQFVSKASFDEVWVLYQQALEEVAYIKADNERLSTRLLCIDAFIKVYFSHPIKINQHSQNPNGR